MTPTRLTLHYKATLVGLGATGFNYEVDPHTHGQCAVLEFSHGGCKYVIPAGAVDPLTPDVLEASAYRNGLQTLLVNLDEAAGLPPYRPGSAEERFEWEPCDTAEATQALLDTMSGRFWAQSVQDRIRKMWEIGGYVIAKGAE